MEEKRAWTRWVRTVGAVQANTMFLGVMTTQNHPTGAMVCAACYSTAEFASSYG